LAVCCAFICARVAAGHDVADCREGGGEVFNSPDQGHHALLRLYAGTTSCGLVAVCCFTLLLLVCSKDATQVAVQAEGVNFEAVWNMDDVFDVNKIVSNDIAAILKYVSVVMLSVRGACVTHVLYRCYGVEAARHAITREIKTVFGVYGIAVDPRHLVCLRYGFYL
jgi:hypothetical protein